MVEPLISYKPSTCGICKMMIITPIPVIKPEVTGCGIRLIKRPNLKTPKPIWNKPPNTTVVKAMANPVSGNRAMYLVTINAITTVIGPVGPDT